MLEQILNQMNVSDKVQVDTQGRVLSLDKFYLLQTTKTKHLNKKKKEFFFCLHLIVFDKYNEPEIDARKREKSIPKLFIFILIVYF
jgi:hypothetical protein